MSSQLSQRTLGRSSAASVADVARRKAAVRMPINVRFELIMQPRFLFLVAGKKETGAFCRNGPKGASHKRLLSPSTVRSPCFTKPGPEVPVSGACRCGSGWVGCRFATLAVESRLLAPLAPLRFTKHRDTQGIDPPRVGGFFFRFFFTTLLTGAIGLLML